MAMLSVECRDCHSFTSLRGWVEPEDFIGTKWEGLTQAQIDEMENENIHIFDGLDPWDKFYENPICPECGSENVISY